MILIKKIGIVAIGFLIADILFVSLPILSGIFGGLIYYAKDKVK